MANVALRNVKKAYPNGFEAIKGAVAHGTEPIITLRKTA